MSARSRPSAPISPLSCVAYCVPPGYSYRPVIFESPGNHIPANDLDPIPSRRHGRFAEAALTLVLRGHVTGLLEFLPIGRVLERFFVLGKCCLRLALARQRVTP